MFIPFELLQDNFTGNENINTYVDVAVRYREGPLAMVCDPGTAFCTL